MAPVPFEAASLKLDNTQVVDFLVSMAAAMSSAGVIDEKDGDNLRLVIAGLQSKRDMPVLLEMIEQDVDFLDLLEARYGSGALAMNLLRHSSRPYLAQMLSVLAAWGDSTLERARLAFNRPLLVFQDGECQRHQLLSTHLLEFTDALAHATDVIRRIQDSWNAFYPHDMAGESDDDRKVCELCAESLGFARVLPCHPVTYSETVDKADLAQALERVAVGAVDLVTRINQNTGTKTRYPIVVASDRLNLACAALKAHALPQSGSRMTFEVRRLAFIETLSVMVEQISELSTMTLAAISGDLPETNVRNLKNVPDSMKRRVAFVLISSRVAPKTAWAAAEGLFRYLQEQNIGVDKLIVSELSKIHPALNAAALEALQRVVTGASLMHLAGNEKTRNLEQVNRLGQAFSAARAAATTLILCLTTLPFLIGCGLKGLPVNDQLEPRPEIPFRAESTALPHQQNGLKEKGSKNGEAKEAENGQ